MSSTATASSSTPATSSSAGTETKEEKVEKKSKDDGLPEQRLEDLKIDKLDPYDPIVMARQVGNTSRSISFVSGTGGVSGCQIRLTVRIVFYFVRSRAPLSISCTIFPFSNLILAAHHRDGLCAARSGAPCVLISGVTFRCSRNPLLLGLTQQTIENDHRPLRTLPRRCIPAVDDVWCCPYRRRTNGPHHLFVRQIRFKYTHTHTHTASNNRPTPTATTQRKGNAQHRHHRPRGARQVHRRARHLGRAGNNTHAHAHDTHAHNTHIRWGAAHDTCARTHARRRVRRGRQAGQRQQEEMAEACLFLFW